MTKQEFVEKLAVTSGMPKNEAEKILNAFLDSMEDGLSAGGRIAFKGFGSFSIYERKARDGRNPATGEPIHMPASKAIRFTVAESLKNEVNKK